jgi:hypothetical protein
MPLKKERIETRIRQGALQRGFGCHVQRCEGRDVRKPKIDCQKAHDE